MSTPTSGTGGRVSDSDRRQGEAIRQMVVDWLKGASPEGPQWEAPDFDALVKVPLELRMVHVLDLIEGEIANAGWGQLLWNCFPHWRTLADVAEAGYLLIGATGQAQAIEQLRRCCAHCEADCGTSKAQDEGERDWFGEGYPAFSAFLARAYAYDDGDWQNVFYGDEAYETRLSWLAENEGRVRSLMGSAN